MYSKLYARITESSLMEEPINVRYTFVMMLAIADPEGYVIGTDIAISRRLNMPVSDFQACISVLSSPDENSNSKEADGRRVLPSDGDRGYRIVNFVNYRDMKSPGDRREYMREYMRKRRAAESKSTTKPKNKAKCESVNSRKPPLAQLRHEDEDAYEYEKEEYTQKIESVNFPVYNTSNTLTSADVSAFLDVWQTLPEGRRGVVRIAGLPPILSPKDREALESFWPCRKDAALLAMHRLRDGAISWDRAAMTISQFANEIDKLCAGRDATEHRTTARPTRASEARQLIQDFTGTAFGDLLDDSLKVAPNASQRRLT